MSHRSSRNLQVATHLLLSIVLLSGFPLGAMAQEYIPPDRGAPGRREGGGTRGNCLRGEPPLIALIPNTNFGTTLEARPTFYWHVPPTNSPLAEFVLLDAEDNEVYRTTFQLSGNPGIMAFSLKDQADAPDLEVGKDYHWYFSLICDPGDRSGDIFAEGWIQRIAPPANLTNQLASTPAGDRATLFAQSGIWYDALNSLAILRQSQPRDPDVATQWTTLLRSVGLDAIANQPFLN
ncbi:DUF928 domain-containing protein [Oscillatoria sp. FACHB-1407]|uniref:DUF928 domain-containing protein n=1 Tax=Oscillatoria sp. FACHB-1407 TaxID=2692847 RepID=UPI0016874E0F|nr:DUF928 domain-containing protein [Oscillatoria sp. FACHB-1407]MBD2460764.1 DUF928 domain-containing protein [Oscillatoria sp. FACHB-1407]